MVTRREWGANDPAWDREIAYYNTEVAPLRDTLWRVVVHHTSNDNNVRTTERRQRVDGYACLAYHLFIGDTGNIYEGRPFEVVGGHAGHFEGNDDITRDPDFGSIGIVLQGDYHRWSYRNVWPLQRVSLRLLLLTLRNMFDIGQVWMHKEVLADLDIGHTHCPGRHMEDRINELRTELDMVPRLARGATPSVARIADRLIAATLQTPGRTAQRGLEAFGGQNLRLGSRGAGVERMQLMLGMAPRERDGVFGSRTGQALRTFQRQQRLATDGILGPASADALIRAFQQTHGLTVDGAVGPQTEAALLHARSGGQARDGGGQASRVSTSASRGTAWTPAPPWADVVGGRAELREGHEGPAVRELQQLLGLGQDGRFGPLTAEAVTSFKEANSLGNGSNVGRTTVARLRQTGGSGLVVPLSGSITSRYGWRSSTNSFHAGVDIASGGVMTVRAAGNGTVATVDNNDPGGYGWKIDIDHGVIGSGRKVTRYAHLNPHPGVRNGQRVRQGEVIGSIDHRWTGRGTGPHLHFEVRTALNSYGQSGSLDPAGVLPSLRNGSVRYGQS